jgi:hypothetical protein
MSDAEHHLVMVTRLWSDAPAVLGVYRTSEEAEAAITADANPDPAPDRYHHETWNGDQRIN